MTPAKLVSTLRRVFSLCFSLAILACRVQPYSEHGARSRGKRLSRSALADADHSSDEKHHYRQW